MWSAWEVVQHYKSRQEPLLYAYRILGIEDCGVEEEKSELGLTILPNYDYHNTITVWDIPIMIVLLSLSRVIYYNNITISKSHSILMNFVDFIKPD